MKKLNAAFIAMIVLAIGITSCNLNKKAEVKSIDAITALVNELAYFDNKIYVYRDYADGWNRFRERTFLGENGTMPIAMQEDCFDTVYSNITSIKASVDFTNQKWGGYIFANGSLNTGETEPFISNGEADAGMDLTGATAVIFYAKGKEGGEKIQAYCGGMGYNEFGANTPFADSIPKTSTDSITLSNEWKQYSLPLKDKPLNNIGLGFAWIAFEKENKNKNKIEFYLDEIYYEFENLPLEKTLVAGFEAYATDKEEYVVNSAAYVDDNAVMCIALLRAGKLDRAKQIADALVFASENDRYFTDGRLRNGYLCGNIESYPGWYSSKGKSFSLMPGFYHRQTKKWHEDYYTVSTDLTSIAYSILALCEAAEHYPKEDKYINAAQNLANFSLQLKDKSDEGFFSGFDGWEGNQIKRQQKNTQYNLEIFAALKRLAEKPQLSLDDALKFSSAAKSAELFVLSQFDNKRGCFMPGEQVALNEDIVLISSNILALFILSDEYEIEKQKALKFIEEELKNEEGFSYSTYDKKGVSFKYNAQMALIYYINLQNEQANSLKKLIENAQDVDGLLPSANKNNLATGRLNPYDGRPVYLYKRKNIGTTAWKALLDMKENPFIDRQP